ncbi:MAG TPA: triose-phosphate isomerase [Bacillota bacterium]
MRKPIIAGNWKMYKTGSDGRTLGEEVALAVGDLAGQRVEVVLCPPFTALESVAGAVAGTPLKLGAQNAHWEKEGPFTGEVSPAMLKAIGCAYVIVGHSERRQHFGETDEGVNKRARGALAFGLTPIICVGERLEERQAGKTAEVVTRQLKGALAGLGPDEVRQVVVAYEPVWAIGTGIAATAADAREGCSLIRRLIAEAAGPSVADQVRIQYGGSVKPENIAEFMAEPDIDGALVGGASLKADSFAGIVRGGAAAKG